MTQSRMNKEREVAGTVVHCASLVPPGYLSSYDLCLNITDIEQEAEDAAI